MIRPISPLASTYSAYAPRATAPASSTAPLSPVSPYALPLPPLEGASISQADWANASVRPAGVVRLSDRVQKLNTLVSSQAYTPAEIRKLYRFDKVTATGRGQTIAIPTAYHSPTLIQDTEEFSRTFGLPRPNIQIVNQRGGAPGGIFDQGWAEETAMDVQLAHAMAPEARILVIEADDSSIANMMQAVEYARRQPNVNVVSMSWGIPEFPQQGMLNRYFQTPPGHRGMTFVAASGDDGAGVLWPAVSANVLAVGGTSLRNVGSRTVEFGWSGSGGGISQFELAPAHQRSVQPTGLRSTPDVALNADPQSGYYIHQGGEWLVLAGTSAAAPQWAGILALANDTRQRRGLAPLDQAQDDLYNLSSSAIRDIVGGNNGYPATRGYDLVTGLGVPVGDRLLNELSGQQVSFQMQLPWLTALKALSQTPTEDTTGFQTQTSPVPQFDRYAILLDLLNTINPSPARLNWWA